MTISMSDKQSASLPEEFACIAELVKQLDPDWDAERFHAEKTDIVGRLEQLARRIELAA